MLRALGQPARRNRPRAWSAYWKGGVAASNTGAQSARARDTRRRKTSPVAIPRTPPAGLRSAVICAPGHVGAGQTRSGVRQKLDRVLALQQDLEMLRAHAGKAGAAPRRASRKAIAMECGDSNGRESGCKERTLGGGATRGYTRRGGSSIGIGQRRVVAGRTWGGRKGVRARETSPLRTWAHATKRLRSASTAGSSGWRGPRPALPRRASLRSRSQSPRWNTAARSSSSVRLARPWCLHRASSMRGTSMNNFQGREASGFGAVASKPAIAHRLVILCYTASTLIARPRYSPSSLNTYTGGVGFEKPYRSPLHLARVCHKVEMCKAWATKNQYAVRGVWNILKDIMLIMIRECFPSVFHWYPGITTSGHESYLHEDLASLHDTARKQGRDLMRICVAHARCRLIPHLQGQRQVGSERGSWHKAHMD